ncbi:MAG: GIY-YIG nuclease family protein [candidate division WOR-3 bacterium]|nr:MAG: GIY-YIG nuclease family protein [candidate division WOR-3 bacterium]
MTQRWFVYIVECKDKSLYIGITRDIEQRIREHNLGKGCRYTKHRYPVKLLYYEQHGNRSLAVKREIEIKKFSRAKKFNLIKSSSCVQNKSYNLLL